MLDDLFGRITRSALHDMLHRALPKSGEVDWLFAGMPSGLTQDASPDEVGREPHGAWLRRAQEDLELLESLGFTPARTRRTVTGLEPALYTRRFSLKVSDYQWEVRAYMSPPMLVSIKQTPQLKLFGFGPLTECYRLTQDLAKEICTQSWETSSEVDELVHKARIHGTEMRAELS